MRSRRCRLSAALNGRAGAPSSQLGGRGGGDHDGATSVGSDAISLVHSGDSARERATAERLRLQADHCDIPMTPDVPSGRWIGAGERRMEVESDERQRWAAGDEFTDQPRVRRPTSVRASPRQAGRDHVLDHAIAAVSQTITDRRDLVQHDRPGWRESNRGDLPAASRRRDARRRPRLDALRAAELLAALKDDSAGRRRCVRWPARRARGARRTAATDHLGACAGSRGAWCAAAARSERQRCRENRDQRSHRTCHDRIVAQSLWMRVGATMIVRDRQGGIRR